jgi:uncharacterized OsmC-like protein
LTVIHATAKLVKGFRIDVDDGRFHAICLDLPRDQGTDLGPSALELALMSYTGCYATIFALTASRMRIALMGLEAKAEAIKSEQAGMITKVKFDITVKSDASEDRIRRTHQLTLKGCPVGKIFDKAGVKSSYNVKIEKG